MMFVNIKHIQCIRRVFACMSSLQVYCCSCIAPCAVRMVFVKRIENRASFYPRAGVSPMKKASTNTRLALLGKFEYE